MKRLIILALVLMGSALLANAQDLIATRNGVTVMAKVLEVSPSVVKYKRFNNLDGPTYTMSTAEILEITYENGDTDTFDGAPVRAMNSSEPMVPGLKYRALKQVYDPKMYTRQLGDISPGLCGIASWLIPGLGQGLSDEWGRALGIWGVELGLTTVMGLSAASVNARYDQFSQAGGDGAIVVMTAALIGLAALDIWNIVDAVRVAKVKNMYYQDLRAQRGLAGLDIRLEPFVASVPSPLSQGFTPSAGLSFKVTLPSR